MLAKKCNVLDVMSVTLGTTNKNNIIYMNYKNIIQFIGAKLKKGTYLWGQKMDSSFH